MYFVFELLFYLGLILFGIGAICMLVAIFRRQGSMVRWTFLFVGLGAGCIVTPMIYTRMQIIDLGPRVTLVQGEKHITLTGWDETNYAVLMSHPETIVLQMANEDVTDETLNYLSGMANIRELDLNHTQVTDRGVIELAKLNSLEVLRLRATDVTDMGVKQLERLTRLSRLDLRETTISHEAVNRWKEGGENRRAFHSISIRQIPVSSSTPTVSPPIANPPIKNPPIKNSPVTNPAVTNPAVTNPPVTTDSP